MRLRESPQESPALFPTHSIRRQRPVAEGPRSAAPLWRGGLRAAACALLVVIACCEPRRARAAPLVVFEIDPAAEAMLDARAARRLVSLELADIDVPPGRSGRPPALFFRVLGLPEGQVRVELWERGELSDVRLVSAASGAHLLPRRVALAAAELARRLRQQRRVQRRQRARQLEQLRVIAALERSRTFEGPLALRSELGALRARNSVFVGSSLALELSLRRALRLDLGARYQGGWDDARRLRASRAELFLGPALRTRLGARWELDFAALAAAAVVHVGGAASVDGSAAQKETWAARAALAARLEPRLSRTVRASVGVEAGFELRRWPLLLPDGSSERFDGPYVGLSLGVVLTPR